MTRVRSAAALAAVIVAMSVAGPARAEFFGCNDRPGKVLYDSSWRAGTTRHAARSNNIFAAQPRQPRVTYSTAPRYSHYR